MVERYRCEVAVILDIDIGNSRCKFRLRQEEKIFFHNVIGHAETISLTFAALWECLPDEKKTIKKILIASVLDAGSNRKIADFFDEKQQVSPLFAQSRASWKNLRNGYHHPEVLGVDRWLAMMAAFAEFSRPCIIVDAGTAITVDAVTASGTHLGGYILPGFEMARQALFANTRRVQVATAPPALSLLPGRDTASAVSNGYPAAISGVIAAARQALVDEAVDDPPVTIICGGDAENIATYLDGVVRPDLVMTGLKLFFE